MTDLPIRNPIVSTLALATTVALLLLGAVIVLKGPLAGADESPGYLAIGDSVSAGVGASDRETTGFVPLFREMAGVRSSWTVSNHAVGGETSTTLISSGQLEGAVAELVQRNQNSSEVDDVEVITLSIGGNDLKPLFETCPTVATEVCLGEAQQALTTFGASLASTLRELRTEAGVETRIIVMTYYNSLQNPECELSAFAPLAETIVAQLNGTIVAVAAGVPGIDVADVAGAGIVGTDLEPDCLHANDSGHRKIADAFAAAYVS